MLTEFDPWRSRFCTCPPKLTLNPYTGCDHGCLYCYASSYIRNFSNCRPKKDLTEKLTLEAKRLKGEIVSMSNSSDPYPNMEAERGLTRACLEILSHNDCKIQIVTKSTVVSRDADLLRKVPSMVTLTITTDDDNVARIIEPHVPSPSERMKAAEQLVLKGLPVTVRIDPLIPFVNDYPERLIKELASIGIKHITSSTYKVRSDNWKRFSGAMPQIAEKLRTLYFEKGGRIGDYFYLPRDLRIGLMKNVRAFADANGVKFGTCREGTSHLNTATCDGSWVF